MELGIWGHPIIKPMAPKLVSGDFRENVLRFPPIALGDDTPVCLDCVVREPGHINVERVAKQADPVDEQLP